jgi:hypothetical protein
MLVRCPCEHCAEGIEFEGDDLSEDNCIVPCPHCGLDTKLVIARDPPPQAHQGASGNMLNNANEGPGLLDIYNDKSRPWEERREAAKAYLRAARPQLDALAKENAEMIRKYERTAKVRWRNDELELDGDRVIIRRRGLANALAVGLNGERTIYISTLTSVQMKSAGAFSPGYILFTYAGSKPFMGGIIEATQDPDAFIFDPSSNGQVAAFKANVENIMRESRQPIQSPASPVTLADELRKLAELRQQGVLSQEEFDVAKKKLLG